MKVSTTEELLAVLPHQLGYHLTDSVAILMVTDKIVGPIARTDIPDERDVPELADEVLSSLLRVEPQLAMLVGYETVPGESRSLMRELHHGLLAAGVQIIDHVVVRDGRWWGWCCRPKDSLIGLLRDHLDGHALAEEATVPAAVEHIARGSAPLASRTAVGALVREDPELSAGVGDELATLWEQFCRRVDPDGVVAEALAGSDDDEDDECDELCELGTCSWCDSLDEEGDELAEESDPEKEESLQRALAVIGEAIKKPDRVPDLWARVLAPPGERGDAFEVSDEELARMVRSLVDKAWRDALIAWMSPVMFPLDKVDEESGALLTANVPGGPATSSDESSTVLRRLQQLARRVPDAWPREAAAICAVAGCVAWGVGNGSTAGDAVSRALRVDPDHRLATFLGRMVEFQMRPQHQWSDVEAWPRAS